MLFDPYEGEGEGRKEGEVDCSTSKNVWTNLEKESVESKFPIRRAFYLLATGLTYFFSILFSHWLGAGLKKHGLGLNKEIDFRAQHVVPAITYAPHTRESEKCISWSSHGGCPLYWKSPYFPCLLVVKSFWTQTDMNFNPICQFSTFVSLSNFLTILLQLITIWRGYYGFYLYIFQVCVIKYTL